MNNLLIPISETFKSIFAVSTDNNDNIDNSRRVVTAAAQVSNTQRFCVIFFSLLLCYIIVLIIKYYKLTNKSIAATSTSLPKFLPINKTVALAAVNATGNASTFASNNINSRNMKLYYKFVQYFSLYPLTYKDKKINSMRKKFKKTEMVVTTERDFKELLVRTIKVGKILFNNNETFPKEYRLETLLIAQTTKEKNSVRSLQNRYIEVVDYLLTKIPCPKKSFETPFKFDWYHFSITLQVLYSQAMILFNNGNLYSEILQWLPNANISLGYTRQSSNVVQMGIPYLIAKCYGHMTNPPGEYAAIDTNAQDDNKNRSTFDIFTRFSNSSGSSSGSSISQSSSGGKRIKPKRTKAYNIHGNFTSDTAVATTTTATASAAAVTSSTAQMYRDIFVAYGPNKNNTLIINDDKRQQCLDDCSTFLNTTDQSVLDVLVDFYNSDIFKNTISMKIIDNVEPLETKQILSTNIRAAAQLDDGLDAQGGYLFHKGLRSYNYYLITLQTSLFYQILYNATACNVQTSLLWITKVLHFGHKFVHPSIVSRYGSFLEFNNQLYNYVRVFENISLSNFTSNHLEKICNLYQNPSAQQYGIYVFTRACFVSCIFKDWSIQIPLPNINIPYGEVDIFNTKIIHQSAMSKIILNKHIDEDDNQGRLDPDVIDYPGVLYMYHEKFKPLNGTKLMSFDACTHTMWGCVSEDLQTITHHTLCGEDGIFISFARITNKAFNLQYSELFLITKFGIIVAYLDINGPLVASNDYKCCIHRYPQIHTEYLTFNNDEFLSNKPLRVAEYRPQQIDPIVVPSQHNCVYMNINGVNIAHMQVTVTTIPIFLTQYPPAAFLAATPTDSFTTPRLLPPQYRINVEIEEKKLLWILVDPNRQWNVTIGGVEPTV